MLVPYIVTDKTSLPGHRFGVLGEGARRHLSLQSKATYAHTVYRD